VYLLDGPHEKAMGGWVGQQTLRSQPEALVSSVAKGVCAIVLLSMQKAAMKEQMYLW
jgi:hypothetical protein